MLPGSFLGISWTTGDAFTFIITTDNGTRPTILHRSVIRKKRVSSTDPYSEHRAEAKDMGSSLTMEILQSSGGRTVNNIITGENIPEGMGSHEETIISNLPSYQQEGGRYGNYNPLRK